MEFKYKYSHYLVSKVGLLGILHSNGQWNFFFFQRINTHTHSRNGIGGKGRSPPQQSEGSSRNQIGQDQER